MKDDNSIINRSCDDTPSRPIAKTELADYPRDLRDLAKEVFHQTRSEGLEVGLFAERLRKYAKARGFCESMVDDYLCVFARSNGYSSLSKPDEQEESPNPSISPPTVSGPYRTVSEPSAFPDTLRSAARRLFSQTKAEGLGFHAFAERVFEWGDANGVSEVTVNAYLVGLADKMGIPKLAAPAVKWQPQPLSFDVEAKENEEKSAAKRRVEAVKKACKAAVWEDPERPNDDMSKRAREFLQDSEWAYLTENELMSVLTGIGEVPIDTRMEIERRLASLRELAKRARLRSTETVPSPKEVLRCEHIQSKIADLEDRLTKGDHRPPEGYERISIADAKFKEAMQLYQTHSNELTALLENIRPYVVSGSKKMKRKRGQP